MTDERKAKIDPAAIDEWRSLLLKHIHRASLGTVMVRGHQGDGGCQELPMLNVVLEADRRELARVEQEAADARDDAEGFQGERNIAQGDLDDTRAELEKAREEYRSLVPEVLRLRAAVQRMEGEDTSDYAAVGRAAFEIMNPTTPCRIPLSARVGQIVGELKRLRKWVADLQSGAYINCVYCGHRHQPEPCRKVPLVDHEVVVTPAGEAGVVAVAVEAIATGVAECLTAFDVQLDGAE